MPNAQSTSDLRRIDDWVEEVVRPSGGLFTSEGAADISNSHSPALLNVNVEQGEVRSRHGYDTIGNNLPLDGDVLALLTQAETSGTEHLVAVSEDRLYTYNTGTTAWDDQSGDLNPAATPALPWSYDFLRSNLILCTAGNSFGVPIYRFHPGGPIWTAFASLYNPNEDIRARIVKVWNDRILLFNTKEDTDGECPSRCRWSIVSPGVTAATDWTDTGSGTWEIVSGDNVTPIINAELLGDQLYVFKGGSIHRGAPTGIATDAIRFTPVVTHRGCGAQRTCQRVGNNILFMGNDGGIYIFGERGETIVDRIDLAISPDLYESLSMSYIDTSFAQVFEEKHLYRLFVPTGAATAPDAYFDYDYLNKTWSEGAYTTDMTCAGMHGTLQIFGNAAGNVYLEDESDYDDATTGYASWYTTKDFRFHGSNRRTIYDRITAELKGVGTFYIDYSVDEGSNWTALTSIALTGTFTTYTRYLSKSAARMRFRFRTDAAADSYFRLREYTVRGKRGAAW